MIQAIILAAGCSARMGEQKLLMPFRGMSMLDFVIKTALSCEFDSLSVVVSRETLDCISPVEGADYIVNPDPDRGQDSSLHCALTVLPVDSSFAVFLADKPLVTAAQVLELRHRFELSTKSALVPRKGVAPGHPAFYSYIWRERFLHSDKCRDTLFRNAPDVEWAEFGDCASENENFFLDVDTMEDYRRIVV